MVAQILEPGLVESQVGILLVVLRFPNSQMLLAGLCSGQPLTSWQDVYWFRLACVSVLLTVVGPYMSQLGLHCPTACNLGFPMGTPLGVLATLQG